MFGTIPPTPYDLRFSVAGIPVRVHPVFWLTSAILAWESDAIDVTLVRVLCIFVAILVHELGHALVTRSFGWTPEIVLYIFGGYATTMRHSTWKDIAVSAAGPAAGFLLFACVWWGAALGGLIVPGSSILRPEIAWIRLEPGPLRVAGVAADFTLFISLVWNVMNLVPVLPLDGGQISRELCTWLDSRRGMRACLLISGFTGAAIALYALWAKSRGDGVLGLNPVFLALMFGYLAIQSWQEYAALRSRYW